MTIRVAVVSTLMCHFATAQTGPANQHWVPTWTTALRSAPPVAPSPVGQPVLADQQALNGFNKQTIRMIVPVSVGGGRVRVQLSNAHGSTVLAVGAAHIALHGEQSAIVPDPIVLFSSAETPASRWPPGQWRSATQSISKCLR